MYPNWRNMTRFKEVKTKENGKKYNTDEVLSTLVEGEKAWVLNHVGYKSYLTKVGEQLFWRLNEGRIKNYESEFYLYPEDWNALEWFIEVA